MVWIVFGTLLWISSYVTQRQRSSWWPIFHIPGWFVWFSGNPRGDGWIELREAGKQIIGLIWVFTGACLVLLHMDYQMQIIIGIVVMLLVIPIFFIPIALVERRIVQQYYEAVESAFGYLLTNDDFEIVRKKRDLVILDSPNCRIRIRLDGWETMVVSLEPIMPRQKIVDSSGDELDLLIIMYCSGEKSADQIKLDVKNQNISAVAERAVSLLRQYGTPMIHGDMANWSNLKSCEQEYVERLLEQERKNTKKKSSPK